MLTLLEGSGKQTVDLNDLVALSNQAIVEQRKPSVDSERTVSKGMCLVVLGRCYVHMQTQSETSSRTVEALRVLKAAMDLFKVKDLPEGRRGRGRRPFQALKEARPRVPTSLRDGGIQCKDCGCGRRHFGQAEQRGRRRVAAGKRGKKRYVKFIDLFFFDCLLND